MDSENPSEIDFEREVRLHWMRVALFQATHHCHPITGVRKMSAKDINMRRQPKMRLPFDERTEELEDLPNESSIIEEKTSSMKLGILDLDAAEFDPLRTREIVSFAVNLHLMIPFMRHVNGKFGYDIPNKDHKGWNQPWIESSYESIDRYMDTDYQYTKISLLNSGDQNSAEMQELALSMNAVEETEPDPKGYGRRPAATEQNGQILGMNPSRVFEPNISSKDSTLQMNVGRVSDILIPIGKTRKYLKIPGSELKPLPTVIFASTRDIEPQDNATALISAAVQALYPSVYWNHVDGLQSARSWVLLYVFDKKVEYIILRWKRVSPIPQLR
jgi:hypothetical protein